MIFDFKKIYKEYYVPKTKPNIVTIPKMNYIAVRGKGNPGEINGEYSKSIELLYSIAYTLKMSYKSDYKIKNFEQYVVPPLEGFWWQEGIKGYDKTKKDELSWISIIRLPDFITKEDFNWAIKTATIKKKKDFSKVEFLTYDEGLCVQCLHIGPFDDEPQTTKKIEEYIKKQGYKIDIGETRHHHEIYLSDPRKTSQDKLKTVIRHPIR